MLYDENGDSISYSWISDGGSFPHGAVGPQVEWEAPSEVGIYTISIVVSDDKLSTEKDIYISVQNSGPLTPSNPRPEHKSDNISLIDTLFWESSDINSDTLKYGVYFGMNPDPPLVSAYNNDTLFIPGLLKKDTKYYWKVSVQDNHGNETVGPTWHFTTFNTRATFTDPRDNSVYRYRTMGTQDWMLDNLKYFPSLSLYGQHSDSVPHYYVHGYDGTNLDDARNLEYFKTYGVIYNWEAALEACPPGWHLPSDDKWTIFEKFMGMTTYDDGHVIHRRTIYLGYMLKADKGWKGDNNGVDSEGFAALPAGRYDEFLIFDISNIGFFTAFWTSTGAGGKTALFRSPQSSSKGTILRRSQPRYHGFSVRCVR